MAATRKSSTNKGTETSAERRIEEEIARLREQLEAALKQIATLEQRLRSRETQGLIAAIAVAIIAAIGPVLSALIQQGTIDRLINPSSHTVSVDWGGVTWLNNPQLGKPDYAGKKDLDFTLPISEAKSIELPAVKADQILVIEGYAATLPGHGSIGGPTHCFLMMTKGPLPKSVIDLEKSQVEIHNISPAANTLSWAAQKAKDMRKNISTCEQEMDIWIGRE